MSPKTPTDSEYAKMVSKVSDSRDGIDYLSSECDRLRAENERLKDTPGGKRLYSQWNEIERLRAALGHIAKVTGTSTEAHHIASDALASTKDDGK